MKRVLYHLRRIISSAIFGLLLFTAGVIIHPVLGTYVKNVAIQSPISLDQLDTSIEPQLVIDEVNSLRADNSKPVLKHHSAFCQSAKTAVANIEADTELDDMLKHCPDCQSVILLTMTGTYDEKEIVSALKEKHLDSLLSNSTFTCVEAKTNIVAISLGTLKFPSQSGSTSNSSTQRIGQATTPPMREIPDFEVVNALNHYRASHNIPQLVINQDLCNYAQKRVGDLVAFGGLDNHAGFRKDFESDQTPKELGNYPGHRIGENLAHQFCYRGSKNVVANNGTALIEWCFDSSTMGHREAQLSPSFNAVCVRHAQNMYVVIFGE